LSTKYKDFKDFAKRYDGGFIDREENSKLFNYCSSSWQAAIEFAKQKLTSDNKDCAVTSPAETTHKPDKSGFAQS
jgi:hypothetical protein